MLINGININTLGVKLYDRVINSNTVDTTQEWLDGDIQPTFVRQQDRFKTMMLSFLVLNTDEENAFLRISRLTQALRKATLQFDDINLTFDTTLVGAAEPERLKNGNFIVKYTLNSDYAQGNREVYTTDAKATSAFRLTVLYYKNTTQLVGQDVYTIRAGAFDVGIPTLSSIGINVDKYREQHYNAGAATNMGSMELTYENLQSLGTLIINYAPVRYNLTIAYYMNSGEGYNETLQETITFTHPQLQNIRTIGQLFDVNTYRPDGYRATIDYSGPLTVEALLAASPISVMYDVVQNEQSKNITVVYRNENDAGGYDIIDSELLNVRETSITDGKTLRDIFNLNAYKPNDLHYFDGAIEGYNADDLITYADLNTTYYINYRRQEHTIYVEYYAGTYPDWYRLTNIPLTVKYKDAYENEFSIEDIGLDLDRYHTAEYQRGQLYNADNFDSYDDVITTGVLQVYYVPINFTIKVRYKKDDANEYTEKDVVINALQFFGDPVLSDIIDINTDRPEGYQLDLEESYNGEITLSALTMSSPIYIVYEEIQEVRQKNIIVRYKQQLSSAYSTINTSILVINEADCVGGVRLRDLINLNLYRPDYYDGGILNGASESALLTFDDLLANYEVLYRASTYNTPVYYYTDDVDERNWIGSSVINYTVLDFTTETTLYDLGLDPNQYKPSYAADGVVQYNGAISFSALRGLSSINIVYDSIEEPEDPSGIDYPHRFLFLQHNDLGAYENQHPEWTMNHAYINTGVSVQDMSKLTVIMEAKRVDEYVAPHTVNAGYAYLFGSSSALGQYYMRFNNQTMYGTNLTGVNTYEAKAGNTVNALVLTEENAIGWSENSGIYSTQNYNGYSTATFTYSNRMPTEHAQMPYPLYLFANNNSGSYADGLAGWGIYSCKILYNGQLLRDFIPVQYYDKIGDKIAPSNCLYDKISQNFFEDATGKNSFNIIDDERYTDTNPEHQIGSFYVNYYKDDILYQTSQVFFRGNDFDEEWDMYDKLKVDDFQPPYYKPGKITNLNEIAAINFDNLNNFIFKVVYEAQENQFQVNYYKDSINENNLIATDTIALQESDFFQVPTFGDIVRLNKYRPEGYKTDFEYPGAKVSLSRVMENAPYNILYVPAGTETTYTTSIKYIKKVFGIRTYETLGTVEVALTDSQFRDGEYIENFIDFNAMKPANYYKDGAPYQWYLKDIRLDTPDKLAQEYIVVYQPEEQALEIRYYKDEVAEESLIANTAWMISVDDFDGEFYLVDQLPNSFINQYKPVNADGGILQNTDVLYTFASLVEYGHIDIIYNSIASPDDPTNVSRIGKVLYWSANDITNSDRQTHSLANGKGVNQHFINGGIIPYIDLGYTPKEIGRLKVELKAQMLTDGYTTDTTSYGYQVQDYTYGFGYYGALGGPSFGTTRSIQATMEKDGVNIVYHKYIPNKSFASNGAFAIRGHVPRASKGVYTDIGLATIDGQKFYTTTNGDNGKIVSANSWKMKYNALSGMYRKGVYEDIDENYEYYKAYNDYSYTRTYSLDTYQDSNMKTNESEDNLWTWMADPITMTLDAYHSYASAYDFGTSNTLTYTNFDESADTDIFENRCKPHGSITLFRTRNPDTGRMNIMPFAPKTYPLITGLGIVGFSTAELNKMLNPFSDDFTGSVIRQITVAEAPTGSTDTFYKTVSQELNVAYSDFPVPVYPQMQGMAVWSIKLWDQDRLVRDMIPVKKGEKIYDYVMPDDGLFDLITEIFFGNNNLGGTYTQTYWTSDSSNKHNGMVSETTTIEAADVLPLHCIDDPCYYGKITENYYDEDNHFIANQYVDVPTWFYEGNTTLADELQYNDYKPDDYHLDGVLDTDDPDNPNEDWTLKEIYDQGLINIYYKLRTYAKSVVYYQDNYRIGSRDLFFSLKDIENANSLSDLGIDASYYQTNTFKPGRLVFNSSILENNDVAGFIDAPSPIVVYDKYSKAERPDLLYIEYYRGGAYDDPTAEITLDGNNVNYFNCDLPAVVLNPNGTIKYRNHYHSAMYEDEDPGYFVPYQVRVINPYTGIHYGPARKYRTLAQIVDRDVYTIVEERNGWGRLKEYYHGWIMLSATEMIVGPGQNPDYDTPTDQTAVIPFAEHINITRLTVDRLWAYVPTEESWIKAEDISYDQAGKLYNALGLQVIDLENDVDWNNVSTIADIGINPEAKHLHYHDYTNYVYDGAFTKEAFSNIHDLEFVYPETVYNYNCIYYKGNKFADNELGRTAFSCSISDWNPDWDHFIETSWVVDEDENEVLPELYRGAPISLNWDYFGFDRNLFKPTGYYDGIYLWNPHPWDEEHLYFTFEELVRTGTQYVIYPFFDPHAYKYWHMVRLQAISNAGNVNQTQFCLDSDNTYTEGVWEIEPPMKRVSTDRLYNQNWGAGWYNDTTTLPAGWYINTNATISSLYFSLGGGPSANYTTNSATGRISSVSRNGTGAVLYPDDYFKDLLKSSNSAQVDSATAELALREELGLSNMMEYEPNGYYRITGSATSPYSDLFLSKIPYHNEYEPKYYISTIYNRYFGQNRTSGYANKWRPITSQHLSLYQQEWNPIQMKGDPSAWRSKPYIGGGVYHGVRSYLNGILEHYYVPVPKGMWYEWDGVKSQITGNGLFDLITGTLKTDDPGCVFTYDYRSADGEEPYEHRYDYFSGWQYDETAIQPAMWYKITASTDAYHQPDALANKTRTLSNGLYLPVDKQTQDTENRVQGLWYHSANYWFKVNSNISIATMTGTLTTEKITAAVIPDTNTTITAFNYDAYDNPDGSATSTRANNGSFLLTSYYTYNVGNKTLLFGGNKWYDMAHTSLAHEEMNKNYVVSIDRLSYYTYPIENDTYKAGQYLAGDRLFVPYCSSRNTNWYYTGQGWVKYADGNLSLVE